MKTIITFLLLVLPVCAASYGGGGFRASSPSSFRSTSMSFSSSRVSSSSFSKSISRPVSSSVITKSPTTFKSYSKPFGYSSYGSYGYNPIGVSTYNSFSPFNNYFLWYMIFNNQNHNHSQTSYLENPSNNSDWGDDSKNNDNDFYTVALFIGIVFILVFGIILYCAIFN